MPTVTFREYNPDSGALMGNVSTINFGEITAGSTSKVKVIDIVFGEVDSVSNVKIGLIANGGLTVNEAPKGWFMDGSTSNGRFGIESSSGFTQYKTKTPLSRHFGGANTDGTSYNVYNVSVGNRADTISNYIYLDVEVSTTKLAGGNGAYKVFFDYS